MVGCAHQGPFMPGDPLVAVGTSMLQQSGKTYFESGRRYVASWGSVVSGGLLHYHFDINTEYGEGPCTYVGAGQVKCKNGKAMKGPAWCVCWNWHLEPSPYWQPPAV